jgi:predicted nuclease of predicted toxin-antitoxin system
MRFLVDVRAGKELADWLREQGHDVKEVREYNPRMNDDEILDWAKAEGRVIVTMDKDFGELAVVQRKTHCGIVRLPDVPVSIRKRLMEQVIAKHEEDLAKGAIVTVTLKRIRIRLPR